MPNIHLTTALSYIKRSPFYALAAIFVLSLTFFVATMLAVLVYSSGRVLSYFETRPQVIAFLKDSAKPEEISALQNNLTSDPRVEKVKFVSKEEALSIYKQATSDNPLLGELVSPSIFPASLEFSLKDLSFAQDMINELKSSPIVDQVGFTASLGGESTLSTVVTRLRTITMYLRLGGGIFVGILTLTSFLVLLFIISMRMTTRKDEVEILDLIGATPGFIRSPIILEAVMYAVGGVLIGWVLSLILILYASPTVIVYFGEIPVLPRQPLSFFGLFGIILAIELFVGLFLALLGSLLAVSRVRRYK